MSNIEPISALLPQWTPPSISPTDAINLANQAQVGNISFAQVISNGLQSVDNKVSTADSLLQRFALGEDIPVHQVTTALEEARFAVEMATQIRARLVETYRDFMTMQI